MIREIVEKNFKKTLTQVDEKNYKVTFEGIGGETGYVHFKEAKNGWNNKPISQNVYLISDADLFQIINFLQKYMSLDESKLEEVRKAFIDISFELFDELSH